MALDDSAAEVNLSGSMTAGADTRRLSTAEARMILGIKWWHSVSIERNNEGATGR